MIPRLKVKVEPSHGLVVRVEKAVVEGNGLLVAAPDMPQSDRSAQEVGVR